MLGQTSAKYSSVTVSDVMIDDTIVYRGTITIHDTLSSCVVSSQYIVKLYFMYENSHRIVRLSANTPN